LPAIISYLVKQHAPPAMCHQQSNLLNWRSLILELHLLSYNIWFNAM